MSREDRFGKNNEARRIKRKPMNITKGENERNRPLGSREGFGAINYDPVFGWTEKNYYGKNAKGTNDGHYSTNSMRRSDGLPGSRI